MQPSSLFLAPTERLSPDVSAIWVDVVGLWLFVLVALVALGFAIYNALRVARAISPDELVERPRPGPAVVSGTVLADPRSTEPFVRVRIVQQGDVRRTKHGFITTWTERERRIDTRPFYLQVAPSATLRVEPGTDIELLDTLEPPVREGRHAERVRAAVLTPGERVFVRGVLVEGDDPAAPASDPYRGGRRRAWVLRPGGDGRMLVSTELLTDRFSRRMHRHLLWAAVAIGSLALWQLGIFDDFRTLREHGVAVTAPLRTQRAWTTHTKSGYVHHCEVTSQLPDGTELKDRASLSVCNAVPYGTLLTWTIDPRPDGTYAIGGRDALGITSGMAVALVIYLGVFALGYGLTMASARRWYDQRKLVETESGDRLAG